MSKTAKLIEIRAQEKEILKISERTAKVLEAENNIVISHPAALATIAYTFLREAIVHLNETKAPGTDTELNLMQLMDIGISHRESEDAEKTGNYTPYIRPGQEMKLLVKDDNDTEE